MPFFQLFRKPKKRKAQSRWPYGQDSGSVVLRSERSGQDVRSLVARYSDGDLIFEGQDLGPSVERFFGEGQWEYEWVFTVRKANLPKLEKALNTADLLAALQRDFSGPNAAGIEAFLKLHNIPYEIWNRVGG